jgi:hypothetical protein
MFIYIRSTIQVIEMFLEEVEQILFGGSIADERRLDGTRSTIC